MMHGVVYEHCIVQMVGSSENSKKCVFSCSLCLWRQICETRSPIHIKDLRLAASTVVLSIHYEQTTTASPSNLDLDQHIG